MSDEGGERRSKNENKKVNILNNIRKYYIFHLHTHIFNNKRCMLSQLFIMDLIFLYDTNE